MGAVEVDGVQERVAWGWERRPATGLLFAGWSDQAGCGELIERALHDWVSPFFTAVPGFPIRAAHFVERHGLIVLIALGESIVAVGIGMAGHHLRADRVVTAVLALALAAALWWLYFDGEDERAERVLDAAGVDRTIWLGLYGFGYAFLPILGGIIVFAAGVKNAVVQSGEPLTASTAWLLAAGVATYSSGWPCSGNCSASAPSARAWRSPAPCCPPRPSAWRSPPKHSWACWQRSWSAASWPSPPGSAT
jgi:hypothetical protein